MRLTAIASLLLCFVFAPVASQQHKDKKLSRSYYVDTGTSQHANKGTIAAPFSDLSYIASLPLNPGDTVFLASGATFYGSLELTDVHGTKEHPVVVTTYYPNKNTMPHKPAVIDAKAYFCGVLLTDCSGIEVKDIHIRADGGGMARAKDQDKNMRCGVLVRTGKPGICSDIVLSGLLISDVFYEEPGFVRDPKEVKTANGTQRYGWGIRFINNTAGAWIRDVLVENCIIRNVSHTGLKFTTQRKGITNVTVSNNQIMDTGGPGIQLSGVYQGNICDNIVDGSGSNRDSRNWSRGSGLWTWNTSDLLIERNQFLNANGPGDSAGAHIDYHCNNIILQYNLSVNNAGGFCEILGNNYNCAYRYNVSINDGYRIKGKDGAFQEGKIFWLSGYIGKHKPTGPFNSYFYNNTIYVNKNIEAKFAVAKTSEGVCVVNNIFVIEGNSSEVQGDQYVPDQKGDLPVKRVIFENNLYLKNDNWPESVLIQDNSPVYGNPEFVRTGGLNIRDYIPQNIALIRDKGIEIPKIPGDTIGLTLGLNVEKDILGNKITGKPDMGAIEINY